jgi:hypothetical protein
MEAHSRNFAIQSTRFEGPFASFFEQRGLRAR